MASYQKTMANFSLSLLAGIAITVLLFVFQPLLTKFANLSKTKERGHAVVIQQYKPPPPPELQEEERIEEKQKTTQNQKEQQMQRMQRPKIDMAMSGLTSGLGGTIEIGNVLNKDFKVSDSLFVSAFKLSEVDEPPRLTKSLPPRYPFEAKQKGISGKVKLRFVVDSNGVAREPQVVSAEPKGIFEEAALEAVVKYKFKPAKKGGKAVDCIVLLPISFDLSE
ncbi:MAG: TonB family protein [Deltaproteobacteria bacterium]|nr:TonB family protein [Deltaproteobacteria bacterium]